MQPFVIKGCIQIGWVCCKRTENQGLSAVTETGKPSWGKKTQKNFFYRGVKENTGLSIYKVSKKNATFYDKMLRSEK